MTVESGVQPFMQISCEQVCNMASTGMPERDILLLIKSEDWERIQNEFQKILSQYGEFSQHSEAIKNLIARISRELPPNPSVLSMVAKLSSLIKEVLPRSSESFWQVFSDPSSCAVGLELHALQKIFNKLASSDRSLPLEEQVKEYESALLRSHLYDSMTTLSCSSKGSLYCLPQRVDRFTDQITQVLFSDFQFAELPSQLEQCTRLQLLTLHGNSITDPLSRLPEMPDLTWLDISQNGISKLSDQFRKFPALETLQLYKNRLAELPESIFGLEKLTKLWLNDNHLKSIPAAIVRLRSLESLFLGGNQLSELPESFAQLKKLGILWLNNNLFTYIPQFIERLDLRELYLQGNPLKEFPKLPETLHQLTLDQSQIEKFEQEIAQLQRERPRLKILNERGVAQ